MIPFSSKIGKLNKVYVYVCGIKKQDDDKFRTIVTSGIRGRIR